MTTPSCVKGALTSSYGPTSLGKMLGATSGVPVPSKCCQMKVLFKGTHSSRTVRGLKLQLTFPKDSQRQQWHLTLFQAFTSRMSPCLALLAWNTALCLQISASTLDCLAIPHLEGFLCQDPLFPSLISELPIKKGLSCCYCHAHTINPQTEPRVPSSFHQRPVSRCEPWFPTDFQGQ